LDSLTEIFINIQVDKKTHEHNQNDKATKGVWEKCLSKKKNNIRNSYANLVEQIITQNQHASRKKTKGLQYFYMMCNY
jgi:16S rRNA A1518/A1519 N6-dimethyltransferase RsmA/KsgA/DIM1 with predicted DNA glycosylase/AP lyase activity